MGGSSYSHCPNCLAEYRPGFDTCADCGTALAPGPAPKTEEQAPRHRKGHRHPAEETREVPVVLCRLPLIEAQILAGQLEAAGLVATVDEPGVWTEYGLAISVTAGLRVWVLESQLDQAREISRRALSGEDAV